ncbi:hypothetical protein SAMN05216419_100395 [Nitrosomonas cryotolerans]|uniref:Uncharacterized protein n=1 Tax=Nitrosomonas cryotolerans ATCC 49181 TaxID=1131553 RepID=A0A1N6J572_9PROT|nr:hypothetical protein [Nitrosomonas cryotolerans]SFP46003.1 hypothetical protein SAMN05216419_100395 [Nitrosomonas cryotolerans]SIO39484.1 hypothetical protein SAMN02743940_2322 [Nitrosomonas cryotolerans ATCC 49181]
MQPTVLIDQHRHTAIIVATNRKKQLVIKLGKGKLTVSSISTKEIKAQGYTVSDYPPKLAAQSYLYHGAGVSDRAKRYLEEIANGEFPGMLVLA